MNTKSESREPSDSELSQLKSKLKAGKLTAEDLNALKGLIERAEKATTNLRAAIVE